MLRRGERVVVLGAIGAVVLAAVAGVVTAPTRDLEDPRLSTYLAGPHGAKGLAQTLRRLGMTVEQRRHPYFDLAGDSAQPPRGQSVLLAFLDIDPPTARELATVRDYVTHGGRIFVAGVTGIETCFGYRSRRLRRGAQADSSPVVSGAWRLPRAGRVLERIPAESLAPAPAERPQGDRCAPRLAARVDTLLGVRGGRPLAVRLIFPTGGEALLLADGGFLTNRSLKETDAGLAVLPWFADGRTRRVVVDEYHQGFGAGGFFGGVGGLAGGSSTGVGHPSVRGGGARGTRSGRRALRAAACGRRAAATIAARAPRGAGGRSRGSRRCGHGGGAHGVGAAAATRSRRRAIGRRAALLARGARAGAAHGHRA